MVSSAQTQAAGETYEDFESSLANFQATLLAAERSGKTIAVYVADMRDFASWFSKTNGAWPVPKSLTPADVREYRGYLQTVKRFKVASINRKLASLAAYTKWCRDTGQTEYSATNGVRRVKSQPLAPRALSKTAQYALIRAAQKNEQTAKTEPAKIQTIRDRVILILMLHTGLRLSELIGLEMEDVEISERKGTLRIMRGKGDKAREVPLNNDARKAIRDWLAVRNPHYRERTEKSPTRKTSTRLFPSKHGAGLTPSAVYRRLKLLADQAKIDDFSPHSLRHTFATNLIRQGVPLEQVATLLGHTSMNTTRRYTTPSMNDLSSAVDKLSD